MKLRLLEKVFPVLLLVLSVVCFGAMTDDIDFINLKNRVNADSLTFARNGVAIERDGTERAVNTIRTDTVAVASPIEQTSVATKMVLACDDEYIYANDYGYGVLYRSKDGVSWSTVYTFNAAIGSGFVTSKGTLLVALSQASGTVAGTLCRRTGTYTFTEVMGDDEMQEDSAIANWSYSEVAGHIFVAEYDTTLDTNNARRVFLSKDDGVTWTRIYGPAYDSTDGNVAGQHAHTIVACLVDGHVRCYTTHGDAVGAQAVYYLEEGASGWDRTAVTMSTTIQPTAGIWIPERDEIVWGTDGGGIPVGIVAMSTQTHAFTWRLKLEQYQDDDDNYDVGYNFLGGDKRLGFYVMGAVQAASNTVEGYTHHGVYMSQDAVNWTRVASFPSLGELSNIRFSGVGPDGKLWFGYRTASVSGSVGFLPPRVETVKGALIERLGNQSYSATPSLGDSSSGTLVYKWTASTNYAAGNFVYPIPYNGKTYEVTTDAGSSSGSQPEWPTTVGETVVDDGITWTCRADTWTSADLFYGDPDLRWYGTVSATKYLTLCNGLSMPAVTAGDVVNYSFRVKGTCGDGSGNNRGVAKNGAFKIYARMRKSDGSLVTLEYQYLFLSEANPQWQWFNFPLRIDSTISSDAQATFSIYAAGATYNQQFDMLIDGITVEKAICPAEYHITTTDRPADVLSYTPETFPSAAFTDVFTVATRFGTFDMGAWNTGDAISLIYLRSYAVDNDNFFAVVFNVADDMFKLVNEVAGVQTVVATSAAYKLTRDDIITVGVTRSGTTASMTVWACGTQETVSGTITNHTIVKSYYGCHPAGTQGGSLIFLRNKMFNTAYAAADLEAEMQWPGYIELPAGVGGKSGSSGKFGRRFQ